MIRRPAGFETVRRQDVAARGHDARHFVAMVQHVAVQVVRGDIRGGVCVRVEVRFFAFPCGLPAGRHRYVEVSGMAA
ncbi:hypothetical protein SRIMM317S_01276 [Streptomyces rimosus subsp. rimosus]